MAKNYEKLNSKQKCFLVYDCCEEISMGSSASYKAYPFTDEKLKNEFVKRWNEGNSKLEKSKEEENKYFCNGWRYWLEFEDGFINFQF